MEYNDWNLVYYGYDMVTIWFWFYYGYDMVMIWFWYGYDMVIIRLWWLWFAYYIVMIWFYCCDLFNDINYYCFDYDGYTSEYI